MTLAAVDGGSATGATTVDCARPGTSHTWQPCRATVHLEHTAPLTHVQITLQFRALTHGRLLVDDVALGPAETAAPPPVPSAMFVLRDHTACRVEVLGRYTFSGGGAAPPQEEGAPPASDLAACVHLSVDRLQHAVRRLPFA